jgi:hypothetical protein
MGELISIREAMQTRRRQRRVALTRRCRDLIAEGADAWRAAYVQASSAERPVCAARIDALEELLAYTDRLL